MNEKLKAPFPYFGGKSKIGPRIWELFGPVKNYVEPFAGSLATLLARPSPVVGPETVNDWSAHVSNVWRAIQRNPQELAALCVGPACEIEKEATHNALVKNEPDLRTRMGDPNYCDIRAAAWWIKGANEWIGGGWCDGSGPWQWSRDGGWAKRNAGTGINRQLPHLGDAGKGQYEQRLLWLQEWFCALRDRLCEVRIACGDWSRICGPSVTTKLGLTAVFLDPPYDSTEYVYGKGSVSISADVRKWCVENGNNPKMRIIICGRGDEHDELIKLGWNKETWSANKGYSNTELRKTETLWYNFTATSAGSLFD